MTRSLSIVGAGKAGKTLARLWAHSGVFSIGAIVNRSLESSRAAAAFLGQGQPAESLGRLDVLLISTADAAIAPCAQSLASSLEPAPGAIVFHLSGSLPSDILAPFRKLGCSIASLHPIKSFAEPALAAATFEGTFCAVEGDPQAVEFLTQAAQRIGARCFPVDSRQKLLYHAGSVFASNYLTAMLAAGTRCLEAAGVNPELALEMLCQIARGTTTNVAALGPAKALTGPIARGELDLVARQLSALEQSLPELAAPYSAAGRLAVELARSNPSTNREALQQIDRLLQGFTS